MRKICPLISCICVTFRKPKMLDLAITSFEAQTYQNKQLVVLFENDDLATVEYIKSRDFSDAVKIIEINGRPKKTLGELRNIAIEQADGELICQWDDDDWYHVNRLQYQFDALTSTGKSGSVLRHWLIFNKVENKLYISHARNWEGSLLCNKELVLLKKYDKSSRGEDTALVEFLCDDGHIASINEITGIYVYIYHGNNTWDLEHFRKIFECSQEIALGQDIAKKILHSSPYKSSMLIDEVLSLNDIVVEK